MLGGEPVGAAIAFVGEQPGDQEERELPLAGFPSYATVHPSYLLRLPDEPSRPAAYRQLRDDLSRARALAGHAAAAG